MALVPPSGKRGRIRRHVVGRLPSRRRDIYPSDLQNKSRLCNRTEGAEIFVMDIEVKMCFSARLTDTNHQRDEIG